MTSDHFIASIKLRQVGNNEDIIVRSFSGRRMSGFEIIEGKPPRPPGGRKQKKTNKQAKKGKKKPGVNRVNIPKNVYTCMQGL